MKTDQESDGRPQHEQDLELDKALSCWKIQPVLPPRFQERVWDRIAVAEARSSTRFGDRLKAAFMPFVTRLSFAYSCAILLLVIGMTAGSWAGRVRGGQIADDLGRRYLLSVNPYAHTEASR